MAELQESLLYRTAFPEDDLHWILSFFKAFRRLVDRYVTERINKFSSPSAAFIFLFSFFFFLHSRSEGDNPKYILSYRIAFFNGYTKRSVLWLISTPLETLAVQFRGEAV
jgi:hypothetical protein